MTRLPKQAHRALVLTTLLQIRDDQRKVLAELRGLSVVLASRGRKAKGRRRG